MRENSSTVDWHRDEDGIVTLTLDDPAQPVNTMNADFRNSMDAAITRLESEREHLAGVVITSAKPVFVAGGDLHELSAIEDADEAELYVQGVKELLARLERLGVPVVAALNGAALGGGLEIALAAHYRIAVSDPAAKVSLGFPEVELGLLPGAGGVVRSVRKFGVVAALRELLLMGRRYSAREALDFGLVDEIVDSREQLASAARRWISANPDAGQVWERADYRMPGGRPGEPALAAELPLISAALDKQLKGAPYPAQRAILAAAVEGAQVDFDSATKIEGRYFAHLATGKVAKNMIATLFFETQKLKGDRGLARQVEPFSPERAVVLGAGMMGSAIAYVLARNGVEVVLNDVTPDAAETGKSFAGKRLAAAVERGKIDAEEADAVLGRITPSARPEDANGAELMIEAVFEDPKLKAEVYAAIEPHLATNALLATNTSTLPVDELAAGINRRQDFIGMHFFSPVDKMPLVELIRGTETSDATTLRALDVAGLMGKTPILVRDSRGFFTSRVFTSFLEEGMAMLAEGVAPASIEQAASQAGYPAPVLQLADELNLRLIRDIRVAATAAGSGSDHLAHRVQDVMLDGHGRPGRVGSAGFYDYVDGKRDRLWPGLTETFPVADQQPPFEDLVERMLFIEAVESVRCLEQEIVESEADANVGSILGIGYPRWTGGCVQYVKSYDGGPEGFRRRANELAARYGERFEPPATTVEIVGG